MKAILVRIGVDHAYGNHHRLIVTENKPIGGFSRRRAARHPARDTISEVNKGTPPRKSA
jgi:hypothetical protein